ncbi:MAG: PKD domain-containing protein [Bacteroidota bacterium]
MKDLCRKARLLSMVILVLAFFGCEDDDEGSKLPTVTAGFTFNVIENTGTVSFINISENAESFERDFGNGITSTEINPTVTFASGTYTVRLTASNVAGASSTFEDQLIVSVPQAVSFPIDFDATNVDYSSITTFDTAFQIVDNPNESGTNAVATKVGEITPNGIPFQGVTFPFETPVDLSGTDKTIELKVLSEVATDILVKFSGGIDGARDVEVLTSHSGSGWETLEFNFATNAVKSFVEGDPTNGEAIIPDGQYANLDLFVGFGQSLSEIIYIDDVVQTESGDGMMPGGSLEVCDGGELVNDFETADDSIFSNFGGGVGTIIDNPDTSVNMSAKVGQYIKNAGEVFGGITIAVDPGIDFNAGVFSIDVYSQAVRQLLFKLEGLNIEAVVPTSGTGWETITYDFSAVAGNMGAVTAITLIMDNGTVGDGSADWTIRFDNIRLCSNEAMGGGNSLEACDGGELVNDFETADDSIFSNFGGGVGTIIDNSDTSVNMSAKVGQYVKNAGEAFGGITIAVDPDIDFNAGVFSIDVSSQTVRQLLFKLEGLDIEVVVPTSGMGWETITYDFSAVAGNMGTVTAITLIMDNGTVGDGSADWTIQFDNIRLCSNEATGGGMGTESPFCRTQVQAFGGDAGSDIFISVFNVDSETMRIEIESADGDPVDDLVLPAGDWNPVPGISSPPAEASPGIWAAEFFYNGGAPENVEFNILWSKDSFGGNWSLNSPGNLSTVPFNATCDASGGGSSTCPAPPTGELLSNGGFEANSGDGACWQLNQGGGTVEIIDTDANTGTYSARLTSGPAQVPNLKQERFATDINGNQGVQVTFRYKITTPFVDGAILQVLAFSERSANGAVAHDLGNASDTSSTGVWQTYTGMFTTDAAVDEGISLLIQATCGGAGTCAGEVLIDDVVVTNL